MEVYENNCFNITVPTWPLLYFFTQSISFSENGDTKSRATVPLSTTLTKFQGSKVVFLFTFICFN